MSIYMQCKLHSTDQWSTYSIKPVQKMIACIITNKLFRFVRKMPNFKQRESIVCIQFKWIFLSLAHFVAYLPNAINWSYTLLHQLLCIENSWTKRINSLHYNKTRLILTSRLVVVVRLLNKITLDYWLVSIQTLPNKSN